jgi:putative transposase
MCDVLQIPRSTFYYHLKKREDDERQAEEADLEERIYKIFKESRNNYGTRKIKIELQKQDITVSRRRISRIMNNLGIASNYTVAYFKPQKSPCNETKVANVLNREFNQEKELSVLVSDLTYVRVGKKWHYVCLFVDLFNREIVGASAGPYKDANLVYKALSSIKSNLTKVQLFHTDRGSEFDNQLMIEATETFGIQRSLSTKGCPYDNAVSEATFKSFKIEFVYQNTFDTLEQLEIEMWDYVNWFNNIRIHQTLGYLTPVEFKQQCESSI